MNEKCNGCRLYENGHCTKYRKNGACDPSTRDFLDTNSRAFIPVDRMCEYSSIFGNVYVGLFPEDLEKLKNGEILHIPGEYGTFIGLVEVKDDGSN